MRLTSVRILNFRSCRDVSLEISGMHALVGANNAGKSSVLRALDFLFNPSTRTLNEESFWNKDTSLEIRVEAQFSGLSDAERDSLKTYLQDDGTFEFRHLIPGKYRVFLYSDDVTRETEHVVQEYEVTITELDQVADLGEIIIEQI